MGEVTKEAHGKKSELRGKERNYESLRTGSPSPGPQTPLVGGLVGTG